MGEGEGEGEGRGMGRWRGKVCGGRSVIQVGDSTASRVLVDACRALDFMTV